MPTSRPYSSFSWGAACPGATQGQPQGSIPGIRGCFQGNWSVKNNCDVCCMLYTVCTLGPKNIRPVTIFVLTSLGSNWKSSSNFSRLGGYFLVSVYVQINIRWVYWMSTGVFIGTKYKTSGRGPEIQILKGIKYLGLPTQNLIIHM